MRPVGPGGRQVIYGGRGPQVVRAVNGVQPMRVMNGQPVRVVYQPSQGGQPIQNLRTQQPQIIQVQQSTVNGRPVIIQRQMSNQQPQPVSKTKNTPCIFMFILLPMKFSTCIYFSNFRHVSFSPNRTEIPTLTRKTQIFDNSMELPTIFLQMISAQVLMKVTNLMVGVSFS